MRSISKLTCISLGTCKPWHPQYLSTQQRKVPLLYYILSWSSPSLPMLFSVYIERPKLLNLQRLPASTRLWQVVILFLPMDMKSFFLFIWISKFSLPTNLPLELSTNSPFQALHEFASLGSANSPFTIFPFRALRIHHSQHSRFGHFSHWKM